MAIIEEFNQRTPGINEALEELVQNPALFSAALLEFVPHDYQTRFLQEQSKRIVVCAGRQVGKSTMAASKAIWFATTNAHTTTLIVSATLRQSMNLFEKILDFSERSPLIRRSVISKTRRQLAFSNGSRIIALPCGPVGNSLRGYTAHLIIVDEAAFVPDDVLSKVIFPMLLTTSGTVILLSTPWDRSHTFYKAFNTEGWAKFHFPSSANPSVDPKFLDEQRELYGEQKFAQEYLAEFRDDGKSYFPNSLLRTCLHVCPDSRKATNCEYCDLVSARSSSPRPDSEFFAGYDPGGMQDPAALVVVERCKAMIEAETGERRMQTVFKVIRTMTYLVPSSQVEGVPGSNNPYTRFTLEVADLHKELHFKKLLLDSTGLGAPIVELCKEIGLPASEMKFTSSSKEEILFNLKVLFERRQIVLPPNDPLLLANLNCIEAEKTRTGGYSFDHPSGTHDDLAYALALAVWTAGKECTVVMMKEGGKKDSPDPFGRMRSPYP